MPTEPASPTFVPETQLSDRESPIEVVNLEKTVSDAEGTRKRSTWTKVEDEADAFWGRVASYYNDNRPAGSNSRKANVIRSHWHNTIQKKVNRFNANYNSIYSLYRSGHSDEDILRFAYEKYCEENNGVAFNLEHVWRIVKDHPMFTPQSDDHFVATKKTRTSESGASNTSFNQNVSIDIDDEDTHPMGRKAAKRKGKDKVKSTMEDLTVNYDSIFSKFNEYTNVKKSEVDLKQKQLEVEEIKAKASLSNAEAKNRRLKLKEYEILNKDTSQMTTEQLIIHECLCKDIRSSWNI
ncbi:glutathione S-transferase T3-like [Henckelia pumila]|uniref:glutathione S-transferase T3-like n=1 Tax=Henckelia pumila TaxID=405737 RepID=UPI003C6DEEB0